MLPLEIVVIDSIMGTAIRLVPACRQSDSVQICAQFRICSSLQFIGEDECAFQSSVTFSSFE